jgi:hypothetical protein
VRRVLSAWVRAAKKAERGTVWGRRGIVRKEGVRGGGHHGAGGEGGGAAADRSRPGRPHIASPPVTVTAAGGGGGARRAHERGRGGADGVDLRKRADGADWLKAEPGEAAYPLEP